MVEVHKALDVVVIPIEVSTSGGFSMARAITGDQLRAAVQSESFIKLGHPDNAEGVKYDFRAGTRVLKATFGQGVDIQNIPEKDRWVEPGEVVFVLTQERLDLPKDMIAVLSPKRKLSHQGIQVLGGLCIDPLYKGPLVVGMYNFSSTRFPLIPGKKLIAAVFYRLEDIELAEFPTPVAVEDFPDELIQLIQNYKPIALHGLQDVLAETRRELAELKSEIISGKDWQREFRQDLQEHSSQIAQLLQSLRDEKENRITVQGEEKESRIAAHREFDRRLADLQKELYKQAARLGAIIGGIVLLLGLIGQIIVPRLIGR